LLSRYTYRSEVYIVLMFQDFGNAIQCLHCAFFVKKPQPSVGCIVINCVFVKELLCFPLEFVAGSVAAQW